MARVALVTGGTRGIGEAICKALKAAGYTVAANYGGNDEAAQKFKAATGKTARNSATSVLPRSASRVTTATVVFKTIATSAVSRGRLKLKTSRAGQRIARRLRIVNSPRSRRVRRRSSR